MMWLINNPIEVILFVSFSSHSSALLPPDLFQNSETLNDSENMTVAMKNGKKLKSSLQQIKAGRLTDI